MSNILTANTSRVPGMLTVKEENPLKNINKLTDIELRDTKSRLENLLGSKSKLLSLPDKGSRIQNTYKRVLSELKRRDEIEEAATMFSKLNIIKIGEEALSNLEWHGNIPNIENATFQDVLDSDDEEEMDPLRLLAEKKMHEKIVKVLPPELSLVTEEDLKELKKFQSTKHIEDGIFDINKNEQRNELVKTKIENETISEKFETDNVEVSASEKRAPEWVDNHVKYLVEKENQIVAKREKFKPYKTTVSNVHDPEKERIRKKHRHWEVTAATPPLIQHKAAQSLSLTDSCELQFQIMKRIKESQEQHAKERLAARIERLEIMKMSIPDTEERKKLPSFTTYRVSNNVFEGNLVLPDDELNEND